MTDIFTKYDLVDVDESFPIPELPTHGVTLLVGSSGSGKSTIIRKMAPPKEIIFSDKPLFQEFSSPEKAEELLLACGLRSIPTWRRPYAQLSNGEQHRAYCAKALDMGSESIDEFTSVVDRSTAKALSYAMQKHLNSSCVRLVIASCHFDIIPWLNPDHIYNCDSKQWEKSNKIRGCLQRPSIRVTIRAERDKENLWELFKKHHYLSSSYNKAANAFALEHEGKIIGMTSIIRFPSGNFNNAWRGHRTVILPEFQGMGLGNVLSETVADMVINHGGRYFSKTSHPALGEHREKSPKWKATSKNRKSRKDYKKNPKFKHKMQHKNRVCYSHEYTG